MTDRPPPNPRADRSRAMATAEAKVSSAEPTKLTPELEPDGHPWALFGCGIMVGIMTMGAIVAAMRWLAFQ